MRAVVCAGVGHLTFTRRRPSIKEKPSGSSSAILPATPTICGRESSPSTWANTSPGNPNIHRAKHDGSGRSGRRQLCLFRGQAGRSHPRHIRPVDVLRPTGQAPGSAVRLGEIHLARHAGANRIHPGHEDGQSVPIHRGCAQGRAAAQVRRHRHEHFRLLHAEIFGRRAGHQVQHRHRLSRRRRDRSRHRARRAALPQS